MRLLGEGRGKKEKRETRRGVGGERKAIIVGVDGFSCRTVEGDGKEGKKKKRGGIGHL